MKFFKKSDRKTFTMTIMAMTEEDIKQNGDDDYWTGGDTVQWPT